jgi:hypothetical protein
MRPYLKNKLKAKVLGCDSNDRVITKQEKGFEFNPQYHQKEKEKF